MKIFRFSPHRKHAFTLIELLVVIGIISVLTTLGYGVSQRAVVRARKIKEVAAAKNLITGFVLAINDNEGRYMYGYDTTAPSVTMPGGKVVTGELVHRYPFRLAPYFDWNLLGTILVNSNVREVGNDSSMYQVSLNPAMGMNIFLVGGELRDANTGINFATECLQRPSGGVLSIVAFASAGYDNSGSHVNGYFKVTPPRLNGPIWSTKPWTPSSKSADFGQVDARYDGQAVCAFADGSVRSMGVEDLRDMRLWSRNAAEQNDKDYNPVNSNAGDGGM